MTEGEFHSISEIYKLIPTLTQARGFGQIQERSHRHLLLPL